MTEEKCHRLIKYVTNETTKLQGTPNLSELTESELLNTLKILDQLRATYFEIVSWDPHVHCFRGPEVEIYVFVCCYRYCLMKYSEVYQTLYAMEKVNECIETVKRNYLRGAVYEKFWLERDEKSSTNEISTIDDDSIFHAEKERALGDTHMMQEGGEDKAYHHYLAATKINDKIRKLGPDKKAQANLGRSYPNLLGIAQSQFHTLHDVLNDGALFRKMMHCMARQENFELADAMYEQAVKAFDDGNEEGAPEKKLSLRFERAAMYSFGALQIIERANDLLKSGAGKPKSEYKEALQIMKHDMLELIQKAAKELVFVIADAMAQDDKQVWSQAVAELAKTYLAVQDPVGKQKAKYYAKEVLKAHSCGDKCVDTILCKQILSVNHPRQIDMHRVLSGHRPGEKLCKIRMVNVFPGDSRTNKDTQE